MAVTIPAISVDDVKTVYPKIPPNNDEGVLAAIEAAKMLVQTSLLDTGCGSTYSEDQLKLIATWLAAHIYQVQSGVLASISAGSASESYQMTTDFFLKGSPHGQNAMLLDTNHCLAQLMADTDLALQGRQSFPPGLVSLHSTRQRGLRRPIC